MKSKPKTFAAKKKSAPAREPKPAPRKVIQVAPLDVSSPYLAIALCDDGTVWLVTQTGGLKTAIHELVNLPEPEPKREPEPA